MALTDLILKQGQIIVIQNDISSAGISNKNYVLFNPEGATKFTISGNNFFLTTEDKIYLTQPSIAP
jgi:hypothetical protein